MPRGTASREILCPRTGETCSVSTDDRTIDSSVTAFEYLNERAARDNSVDVCTRNRSDDEPCGFKGWMSFVNVLGKNAIILEGNQ